MAKLSWLFGALLISLFVNTPSSAQGVQTGVLTGKVVDADGLVLPGVTVTATSSALQGERTTVTDGNGIYSIRGLSPGQYTVKFELSALTTVEASQRVDLGLTAQLDATLQLATVTEAITVTAAVPTLVTATSGGANYRLEDIDKVATRRTVQGIAELAPGLTDNTPNANQVTIAGGFAYDNQFLIDGVDVADNLFGTSNNLFIEDALEEVQVLTSGISAEFGRFGGGVVNAITKSGGNRLSFSFRDNVYKPSWTEDTPFEVSRSTPRTGDVQNVYEWTVGGPIFVDKLWFFHAGRRQNVTTPAPFPQTGIANSNTTENNRFEIKGTTTVWANQTLQGQYLRNNTRASAPSFGFSIDPSTLVSSSTPNDLWVGSWRGVLTNTLFGNVQVSRRKFGFRNNGGTSTAIIDSPFLSRGLTSGVPATQHYNAPYFDATDPEDRNNRQIAGSLSYFLTTGRAGSHDIKGGYENYQTTRVGGNSQTSTGFVFQTDYLVAAGVPVLAAGQRPIPVFTPGVSRVQNWIPTRGAEIDITTQSLYVHDRWTAGQRLTLDLGVRYERVRSEATGDIIGVDTNTWVPRLGATFDVSGDGRRTVQATYAHYAGKYSETQIADNTPVGSPSLVTTQYTGPAGQGRDFAPGFNVANYSQVVTGNFPTANVFFADDLSSPVTREFTVSAGSQIGSRGAAKATYQWRSINGFIEDFYEDPTGAGKTSVQQGGGTFIVDNAVIRNSDAPVRDYQAAVFQGNYRLSQRWTANAHWTLQLENYGNFEGEGTNTPGVSSSIGDYPGVLVADRNFPEGRLNDFQRHKVRAWTTYGWGLGRAGSIDTSLLWRYNSALTYSLATAGVPLSTIQRARGDGFLFTGIGNAQTLFYNERGSELFENSHQFDFNAQYQIPIWSTLRPWIEFEAYNLFNDQSLVSFNTAVTPDAASALDANGLRTGFTPGPQFGQATRAQDFPRATNSPAGPALFARTFLVSFGVRF